MKVLQYSIAAANVFARLTMIWAILFLSGWRRGMLGDGSRGWVKHYGYHRFMGTTNFAIYRATKDLFDEIEQEGGE